MKHALLYLHYYARRDSNSQPSVPKTDALSSCATDAPLTYWRKPNENNQQSKFTLFLAKDKSPVLPRQMRSLNLTESTKQTVFRGKILTFFFGLCCFPANNTTTFQKAWQNNKVSQVFRAYQELTWIGESLRKNRFPKNHLRNLAQSTALFQSKYPRPSPRCTIL